MDKPTYTLATDERLDALPDDLSAPLRAHAWKARLRKGDHSRELYEYAGALARTVAAQRALLAEMRETLDEAREWINSHDDPEVSRYRGYGDVYVREMLGRIDEVLDADGDAELLRV